MAIDRLNILRYLRERGNHLLLDVRSPSEYLHAHIPGAVSFPLFSDEERKIVGTTYKQNSREEAIRIALDMFGPKMRKMVEEAERLIRENAGEKSEPENGKPDNRIFVYCWRGGMRSAAVAWLLDLYGFRVYTLAGGYKAFRNYVLDMFARDYSFKIIGGYTGSGKTEVLQQMGRSGHNIIDLEQIASHKGSAFGSFKMPPQPSQEMFENLLALELEKNTCLSGPDDQPTIWLEDESQRIGNLNIPNSLWKTMRDSPLFFLEIPFESRLDHIMEEYGDCDREKLMEAVRRISKRLGGLETKNALKYLEENQVKEAFRILLQYYDKLYLKGLHNRENLNSLLTRMHCAEVSPDNAKQLTKYQTV